MRRILVTALISVAVVGLVLISPRLSDQSPPGFGSQAVVAESHKPQVDRTPANRTPAQLPAARAWASSPEPITTAELTVSGLEHFPRELISRIKPLPRPEGIEVGDRLSLELGAAGQYLAPIQAHTAHANGDESLLLRSELSPSDHGLVEQAVLTWGRVRCIRPYPARNRPVPGTQRCRRQLVDRSQ